jgi:hypothetical protein
MKIIEETGDEAKQSLRSACETVRSLYYRRSDDLFLKRSLCPLQAMADPHADPGRKNMLNLFVSRLDVPTFGGGPIPVRCTAH